MIYLMTYIMTNIMTNIMINVMTAWKKVHSHSGQLSCFIEHDRRHYVAEHIFWETFAEIYVAVDITFGILLVG